MSRVIRIDPEVAAVVAERQRALGGGSAAAAVRSLVTDAEMRVVAIRRADPDWQGPTPLRWVYDDGGRAAAGYTATAPGDCVVRAIAIASGRPYREVYDEVAAACAAAGGRRSARAGVPNKVWRGFLAERGWAWTPTMAIGSGCTVHLAAGELPATGRLVASVSKHVVAIVDGVIRDTHDPTRGGTRCVYGYYTHPLAP